MPVSALAENKVMNFQGTPAVPCSPLKAPQRKSSIDLEGLCLTLPCPLPTPVF